jgi:CHASE3 domain sensor protein
MVEGMTTQVRDHRPRAGSPALTAISEAASEMEHGLFGRITDRVAANARVIRRAPEAIALTGIITLVGCYFAFQHLQS